MRTVKDFHFVKRLLKTLYIKDVVIAKSSEDLDTILAQEPRLIIALNHGPMMGALAGLVGLADSMQKHGGEKRSPFGITWRKFYELPIAKQLLSFLTQINHGVGFDEACVLLQAEGFTDCVIMPEGELCNFGDGVAVLPFLSPRFIELALVNQCPVLIAVHHGSDRWAMPIKLDRRLEPLFKWLPQHMHETIKHSRTLSIPKPFKKKIPKLYMSFARYQPSLSLKTLSDNKEQRNQQLHKEAEIVRDKMKKMISLIITERRLNDLVH